MLTRVLVAFLVLPLTGCFSGYSEDATQQELRVHRGAFQREVVLSGEVEAARGDGNSTIGAGDHACPGQAGLPALHS